MPISLRGHRRATGSRPVRFQGTPEVVSVLRLAGCAAHSVRVANVISASALLLTARVVAGKSLSRSLPQKGCKITSVLNTH